MNRATLVSWDRRFLHRLVSGKSGSFGEVKKQLLDGSGRDKFVGYLFPRELSCLNPRYK